MRYMLLIYGDENILTQPEREACYGESAQLANDLHRAGKFVSASPLHSTMMATSVRVRDGKRLVTDGPFAETREQLGGFYIVEAKDLDEAVGIAARIPSAKTGSIEVRPIMKLMM